MASDRVRSLLRSFPCLEPPRTLCRTLRFESSTESSDMRRSGRDQGGAGGLIVVGSGPAGCTPARESPIQSPPRYHTAISSITTSVLFQHDQESIWRRYSTPYIGEKIVYWRRESHLAVQDEIDSGAATLALGADECSTREAFSELSTNGQ